MALTKTAKMVGLFIAATLTVTGCSSDYDDDCYDQDNDGYCDDDGGGSRGSSSTYYSNGSKKYKSSSTGVSTGSSSFTSGSKGGIGSSGASSG
ncbi:hypothetical protein AN963_11110 [Brevibacillus choshinensis]|uniref:Lipoprotein n=1 Tax=Brevibacillus choshinensis TaxID=54911 RepID=A0ABR5N4P8_BRECH|nr:hypothetical protein [Brevibacillus choshinensis]KQL45605.1 hypothetical protein AN963_11110 [Brevibacillus choshinensis]